ncbi:YtpR family tRNA-binding protein [Alteribacillus sp. JSM 102045]|uniref:YtpR family tRNA-binding protein n=1 Tax=Alteribacillus sp. JSM 102045 TaxID=1562101 RepID=UPI0035C1241C
MNVFYNKTGIGDTLLVSLKEIEKDKREVERKGDIARLHHKDSGVTAGYNIFNVSEYGTIQHSGMLPITGALIDIVQTALKVNGFEETIELPEKPSFVVGLVKDKKKHPDADKLSVCQVDTGDESHQIVCGAPNVEKGQKVVVALPGAVMPTGMKIKKSKLRGVVSNGMICSAKEIVLPEAPKEKGILVLDEQYETGRDFLLQYHR